MLPDPGRYDTIIVGAGLAGAAAALWLSATQQVLVLEADQPAAGASGAAAGLVNPLMSRKARAVWRLDDALHALHDTLAQAGASDLLSRNGILRPAVHAKQARIFREVAQALSKEAFWLSEEATQERYPSVAAPHGALLVRRGGALTVPAFVSAMLTEARQQGAQVATGTSVIGWSEERAGASVQVRTGDTTTRLVAQRIILALGYGYHAHATLRALNLHAIKGQTVRVAALEIEAMPTVPIAGRGYVVPEGDTLILGSSYERGFEHLDPTPEQSRRILEKASAMLPALRDARVLAATAGVRVTVPGTRLPMLGPLPGHERIWIFTGLGSKGLLMAPLLARHLAAYLAKPDTILPEIAVARRK